MAKSRTQIPIDMSAATRYGTTQAAGITGQTHIQAFGDINAAMENITEGAKVLADTNAKFDWYKGYANKLTEAGKTGDITISTTNPISGSWSLIKHNDSTAPSITGIPAAQLIELHDLSANYEVDTDNHILLKCVDISPLTVTVQYLKAGGLSTVQNKIENGTNKVEVTSSEVLAILDGLKILRGYKIGSASQLFLGDVDGGTGYSATKSEVEAQRALNGYVNNKVVLNAKEENGNTQVQIGAIHVGGVTWIKILQADDRVDLFANNIYLEKIFAQSDAAASSKALSLDGAGKIQYGPISALASAVTLALQNGVQNADLQTEIERIISIASGTGQGLRLPAVADIAARDNLSGLVEHNMVFVEDDGDGKWADYRVDVAGDGTGSNATWVKIADQDSLNNSLSDSSIRAAYLNNAGTEELTTVLLNKLNGIAAGAQVNPTDVAIVASIDAALGQTDWKIGPNGILPNYTNTGSAPAAADNNGKLCFIAGDLHESDGTNWVNQVNTIADSDNLPEGSINLYYTENRVSNNSNVLANTNKLSGIAAGAQVNPSDTAIVASIDAELGQTDWKSVGGGGSATLFDWSTAEGGFSGSDTTNWVESSGDLVSIQDINSAQSFTPNTAGELQYVTGNKFFSADTVDTQLDINTGNDSFLSPGTGEFTIILVMKYEGSNSSRHIKFQNNGSSNSIKIQSSGIEFRANGYTTETISASLVSGTVYFFAFQRMSDTKFRAYAYDGTGAIKYLGETTAGTALDLGGISQLTLGDTEAAYAMYMFPQSLLEASLDRAAAQAAQEYPLGPIV